MRRVAVLVASLLFSGFGIAAAQAHAELVSMSPAAGSSVEQAPASVTLSFNEDVASIGSTIVVLDADGNAMQTGEPRVVGGEITIDLLPLATAGWYHVNFRVLAADGHMVSGSETFALTPATLEGSQMSASGSPYPQPSPLAHSPGTGAVPTNDPTIAYWITASLMFAGIMAAAIAWRAKR